MSIIIPITVLILGSLFQPYIVAGVMIAFEIVFCLLLLNEVKKIPVKLTQ